MIPESVKSYDAIITARYGTVTPLAGGGNEGDSDVITYDAVAVNTKDKLTVNNFKPTRRVARGAFVIVAEPMDPCKIVMVNGVPFLHVAEGVAYTEACP